MGLSPMLLSGIAETRSSNVPIRNVFDHVFEVAQSIESLEVEDVKRELAENGELLLVDLREIQEHKRTIVFCAGGGRSLYAVKAMLDMGYSNVAQLGPGFGVWLGAGEPIYDYGQTSRWVRRDRVLM